jgi:hypothetical protein
MPIDLYTGQPGNGKTVQLMKRLLEAVAEGKRPVYAAGIDGLEVPGVEVIDAKRWNDTDMMGNHIVPNGAIIFVDEAWKDFGHLQDGTRAPAPPHVLALAEHRHRGIDFVWTTQMANQIFPFARGLIGSHTHVVRRFGTQFIDLYKWGELQEDVKSQSKRDLAQRTTASLDTETFKHYKSAELHTIKRKLPWKVYALPAIVLGVIIAGFFAYRAIQPDNMTRAVAGKPADGEAVAGNTSPGKTGEPLYTTAAEYAAAFTPRFATAPWTAPAYDGREVVAKPLLYCISSSYGLDGNGHAGKGGCRCITEQGTAYQIPVAECRLVVKVGGIYNPFKEPPEQERTAGQQRTGPPGPDPALNAPPSAPADAGDAATGPGAFRSGES